MRARAAVSAFAAAGRAAAEALQGTRKETRLQNRQKEESAATQALLEARDYAERNLANVSPHSHNEIRVNTQGPQRTKGLTAEAPQTGSDAGLVAVGQKFGRRRGADAIRLPLRGVALDRPGAP